ncbi:hypothetical protein FQN55_005197 [Onygenales sp. PD_40]|nr:hypothetical protein FQN55_005197 [Onygenales sp. PD_40]
MSDGGIRRFRIAIIGGGLAGTTLANALINIPHLDINVYEAAPEFSERGAAVGLSVNAQRALGEIFPSASDILKKAGAVRLNSVRFMSGSGPQAGSLAFDSTVSETTVVHRASLLHELIAPLPQDILHASKKLASINATGGKSVELKFEDDMVEHFDAVIGADGIFGSVRNHILGGDPKYGPTPAGFWDSRNLVSLEKAKALLGAELFEANRQYGWIVEGAFIMHDVIENGDLVHVVVSAPEKNPTPDRRQDLTRELLSKTLAPCVGGPRASFAEGVIEISLNKDSPQIYSQWEHRSTPTYANGPVCIMGDAAHATTPWQGSGAGMAIEDAMVLGTLLREAKSPEGIESAFKAFDIVRRPRCQRIIDSSSVTGLIMCGLGEGIGTDPKKLGEGLPPRWDFILELDVAEHCAEALETMKKIMGDA